ncbi:MAG: phospholipase D-like domain-containing protein, partial [Elusimicrobia bacterium]|nr:phospholipase D-like domain-containing protein [Elusimicrobiota bacterium]
MAGPIAALLLALLQTSWAAAIRSAPARGVSPQLAVRLGNPATAASLPAPLLGSRIAPPLSERLGPAAAPAAGAAPLADNPGPAVLERLAADIPRSETPAAAGLQGQKDYADRNFEYKLGAVAAESAAPVEPGPEPAPDPAAQRKRKRPRSVTKDDGGGANYSRREVVFNGRTLPAVALAPNISVEEKLVTAIDASKASIRIALYEFKLRAVTQALLRARKRGVRIELILDYSNVFPRNEPNAEYQARRSPDIWTLIRKGVDFTVLRGFGRYGINHNKFAVFDDELVEFGSYNWSFTAENSHYENANFSKDPARVAGLSGYWHYLRALSVPFAQAEAHDWPQTIPPPPAALGSVLFNGKTLPAMVFTPDGPAFEAAAVKAIDAARESVDAAIFAVRSTKIVQALARARSRGLRVRVLFDEDQAASESFGPYAAWLAAVGIETRLLAGPDRESEYPQTQKMHHKFMILDGKLVETGSANWTKNAAMANFENVHFLYDKTDAESYAFAFAHMFARAQVLPKPISIPALPADANLIEEIVNPPPEPPAPPSPVPPPLPAPRQLALNGVSLPSFAFLPEHPIEALYVRAIDAAQTSISLAVYEFASEPILEALRRAKKRGLKIELVLDRSHLYTSGVDDDGYPRKPKPQVVALAKEFDLKVRAGRSGGTMHNKFAVFDGKIASFGSFNLTEITKNNHFENVSFSDDPRRVAAYRRYFAYLRWISQDVDFDKLEAILNRSLDAKPLSDAETYESGLADEEAPGKGKSFPPPPQDQERPIILNGESFPLQIFSPQGGIEEALIRAIQAARFSIDIAMFSFYSQRIADVLLEMKQARPELKIRVLLDAGQAKLSKLDEWFAFHGFATRLLGGPDDNGDPRYQKMHDKL